MLKTTLIYSLACLFLLFSTISLIAQQNSPKVISLNGLFELYNVGLMCTALSSVNLKFSKIINNNKNYYNRAATINKGFGSLINTLLNIINRKNNISKTPINMEEFMALKRKNYDDAIIFWETQFSKIIEKMNDQDTFNSYQLPLIYGITRCVNWYNGIIIKN